MFMQTSRPLVNPRKFDRIRDKTRRIRQSWSSEERRKRFLRGRRKRAEILSLLVGRQDVRGQAG